MTRGCWFCHTQPATEPSMGISLGVCHPVGSQVSRMCNRITLRVASCRTTARYWKSSRLFNRQARSWNSSGMLRCDAIAFESSSSVRYCCGAKPAVAAWAMLLSNVFLHPLTTSLISASRPGTSSAWEVSFNDRGYRSGINSRWAESTWQYKAWDAI